jgi:glycosyltransferase involved in cell wall biosynthesis
MFTYDLTRALAHTGVEQRIAVLRNGDVGVNYEPAPSFLGANGSNVPGLNMDLRAVGSLRQIVKEWDPQVIQAYGGEPLKYTVGASIRTRSAIVYRKIGSADERVRSGPRRSVHAGFVRRAERVVAVAESMRRETIDVFRIRPERVITIPRGIDPDRLSPSRPRAALRRSLGLPAEATVLLSLGALTWEKDPVGQVRIAARVLEANDEAVFLMAGEGPLRNDVEAAAARSSVTSRIRVLGSRADVADLLAASDVLLLASLTEGMPGAVIEAGMAGRPVAAYAISGVPEVVVDGETGLLAAPGDEEALTWAVLSLVEGAGMRRRLGRRARAHCRARFDISGIAARYLALYEELG